MSFTEWAAVDPGPSAKPWYLSKAWFAIAAGLIGGVAALVFGVRGVSVTVSAPSLIYAASVITLTGAVYLLLGFLFSRRELS